MSQPPRGDEHPTAGLPGHPDPGPEPDPGPPQPIPPPDPVPAPEPPHAGPPASAPADPPADPPAGPQTPVGQSGPVSDGTQPIPAHPSYPGGEQPAQRQPVMDPDRTWHAPIPPGQQFQPAHEAHWPPQPGQQQWQPTPLPGGQLPPQHGLPVVPHQPGGPGDPAAPWPGQPVAAPSDGTPPRSRRTVLWLSLATVFTLLLCGGGAFSAFLLLRNADNGDGAPDPATAVTRFLSAVYTEQDAAAANDLVCREARDRKKIAAKVDEVKGYSSQYDAPEFRWDEPAVSGLQEQRATVVVDLTMTTNDEKTAEQRLTFTTVKKTGWWVCEIAG